MATKMEGDGKIPMAGPSAGRSRSAMRGTTILVVDDDPMIAALLAELFVVDGYEVETAANGAIALQKLRERAYDLILCDLKMPELDGESFYWEVARRDPGLCQRFIFITGSARDPETRRFLAQTGLPGLSKPFHLDEIREAVRQALGAV